MDEVFQKILLEKRAEVYAFVTDRLWEMEQALEQARWSQFWDYFEQIRRKIRTSLPFLSDQVFFELEKLEALLIPRKGREEEWNQEELKAQMTVFQLQLAKMLQKIEPPRVEELLDLPQQIRKQVEKSEQELQERKKELSQKQKAEELAQEALELAQKKQYSRARRKLQKAIKLDPTKPVYHNDLGVLLALEEKWEQAEEAYQKALALNEAHPERRTAEWVLTYFNLAKLYFRRAQKRLKERPLLPEAIEEAYHLLQKVLEVGNDFRVRATDERRGEVEQLLQLAEEERQQLRERLIRIGRLAEPKEAPKESCPLQKKSVEEKSTEEQQEEKKRKEKEKEEPLKGGPSKKVSNTEERKTVIQNSPTENASEKKIESKGKTPAELWEWEEDSPWLVEED